MNDPRVRMAPSHPHPPSPDSPNHHHHQISKLFSSDAGYQLLSTVANDEQKLLQDTRKILEDRLNLDRQYAKDLQELTAKADRIAWPTETLSIASACRELLMQWSHEATTIESNGEKFRRHVLDDLIKNLLENKSDARKFIEEQKRQYENEHRKAQIDVAETERRYSNEARLYVAKNNELNKAKQALRNGDDNRDFKRVVIEKRDIVDRAHNEYVVSIREYNAIDEQHVRRIRNLLVYYEEVQLILNRQWQSILKSIAGYGNRDRDGSPAPPTSLIDPSRCYDELCKIHSNIPVLTTRPCVFNELLLRTSGLTHLKADGIIVDDIAISGETINALRQKVQALTKEVNRANAELPTILHLMDQIRDRKTTYHGRKSHFEQEQQADNLRMKMAWKENLKNDLQEALDDSVAGDDCLPYQELLMGLSDRLEDQAYFHGYMPRIQSVQLLTEKGDYLVRMNDRGKIVLSILWTDSTDPCKLKDGHYYIHEKDSMYVFQANSIGKPTVPKLIIFYTRQQLELREDGTRLIRPVEKPDYVINNDEVKRLESLGSGHFGDVYRGEYRQIPVAVKMLHPTTNVLNAKDRENFINEALLLKRYKHKQIVHFIGIAAYREPLMIVMELVEQGSLSNYVKENDLRVSQLIQICYEISKGMAYLESANVIHRDLASRNCLVDKNGRVKVADFGLSRCLQDDQEYFTQTKEFPARWWALEVLSRGPYTTKADVWSYGVTVWEIFSKAALPYTHIQHTHLVIDAVKRGERLPRPEKCPANVYEIMENCWLSNAKDRRSFRDIVEALRKEKSFLAKLPFFGSFK